MTTMVPRRTDEPAETEVVERLQWLLRLRWLIVPIFIAVDLASDLLTARRAPWIALVVGGGLLAANGVYGFLLGRRYRLSTLLVWARFEAAAVVSVPIVVVLLHGDAGSPLRYGVLIGVVGAAAILPTTTEVTVIGAWAVVALVTSDAWLLGFDAARIDQAVVARWTIEAGVILTVSFLAGYLHSTRDWASLRLRAAQEQLERARAEWEATFDDLHEMIFVTDGEQRVIRANRAFAKLLGARPHELAGRRLPELLAGHPERWWLSTTEGFAEIEDPVFDTSFELSTSRRGDRSICVARDVGEQRRLFARLVQADKLASVGVLASGVAHEINNPTAVVTSNLNELKRYVAAWAATLDEVADLARGEAGERVAAALRRPEYAFARREAASTVDESLTAMERIRLIVGNLRSVVRREPVGEAPTALDLGEVVQAVARTAAADLRRASARVEVEPNVWVLGHRAELVDVLLNLVVNAIQATDDGRPNAISIECRREGPTALVRVRDTGKGIPTGHMRRLFEPFITARTATEGPAIGLPLARKIVLAHSGTIDIASEEGAGSTFTVRLPILETDAAERAGRKPRVSA
ncbi:MAG TPA: ATP-binding protein [Anaeromyxobacteraceae bacterium]|nr:ATP-binding protein [Anaeromyxobacteraceae bacterium]